MEVAAGVLDGVEDKVETLENVSLAEVELTAEYEANAELEPEAEGEGDVIPESVSTALPDDAAVVETVTLMVLEVEAVMELVGKIEKDDDTDTLALTELVMVPVVDDDIESNRLRVMAALLERTGESDSSGEADEEDDILAVSERAVDPLMEGDEHDVGETVERSVVAGDDVTERVSLSFNETVVVGEKIGDAVVVLVTGSVGNDVTRDDVVQEAVAELPCEKEDDVDGVGSLALAEAQKEICDETDGEAVLLFEAMLTEGRDDSEIDVDVDEDADDDEDASVVEDGRVLAVQAGVKVVMTDTVPGEDTLAITE